MLLLGGVTPSHKSWAGLGHRSQVFTGLPGASWLVAAFLGSFSSPADLTKPPPHSRSCPSPQLSLELDFSVMTCPSSSPLLTQPSSYPGWTQLPTSHTWSGTLSERQAAVASRSGCQFVGTWSSLSLWQLAPCPSTPVPCPAGDKVLCHLPARGWSFLGPLMSALLSDPVLWLPFCQSAPFTLQNRLYVQSAHRHSGEGSKCQPARKIANPPPL